MTSILCLHITSKVTSRLRWVSNVQPRATWNSLILSIVLNEQCFSQQLLYSTQLRSNLSQTTKEPFLECLGSVTKTKMDSWMTRNSATFKLKSSRQNFRRNTLQLWRKSSLVNAKITQILTQREGLASMLSKLFKESWFKSWNNRLVGLFLGALVMMIIWR